MAVDKKFVKDGKVDYDNMNENFHLKEARAARDRLKDVKGLSWSQQEQLKRVQNYHTKEAMSLRAKQDRKKPKKMPNSALEAVNRGIKDANIAELAKLRNKRIDKASGF